MISHIYKTYVNYYMNLQEILVKFTKITIFHKN
jgi:hypothetical protein